jgi:anti-anti-sigma regulatory factor
MCVSYRIQRSEHQGAIVFALSGDLDSRHAAQLAELLALESAGRILLDLHDITLVDRASVRFLASAESTRVLIINCPCYVRSWMTAERQLASEWP